ncbi:MAG: hypothetical protein H8E73_04030 [Planctomycetes bacterium]|nr:hypothetical protein [Planctomycetota bacterium]MBL7185832.1 hypothetical protein [Phycisphaerae bacterium]
MAKTVNIRLEPFFKCGPVCIKDEETESVIAIMTPRRDGTGSVCLQIVIADAERISIEREDGKALPKPYWRLF